VALVALVEALANLVLSLILVRPLGILGVALGTAIPVFVANTFVLLPAACRTVGLRAGEFARLVLPAPLMGTLPAVLAVILFRTYLPPTRFIAVVGEGAVVGAIYMLAALTLGVSAEVRARYIRQVTRALSGGRLARLLPVSH
jgi:O-antigen/teichoic acid export membrane protein